MNTISTYPCLFTHKGTPIRIRFFSNKKEVLYIEPLKFSSAALILQPKQMEKYGLSSQGLKQGSAILIGHDGTIKKQYMIPSKSIITKIESTVIYPDGSVWEGPLSKKALEDPIALIWSTELCFFIKNKDLIKAFSATHWTEIPTILTISSNKTAGSCFRIEHSCPDCDKSSKK